MLLWPTPTVACATGGQTCRGGDRKDELLLAGMAGGPLNAAWVEALVGFPPGWTALSVDEMLASPRRRPPIR